jgi:outer membrane protein assembly factor BamB
VASPSSPLTAWSTSGGDASRRGVFHRAVGLDTPPYRALPAQGAVQASVVFDPGGRVFVADMAGGVQAYSREGGSLWQKRLAGGISASPVVDLERQRLIAATHAGWVYALETASGAVAWQTQIPTKSDARILSDLLFLPKVPAIVLSSWGGRFCQLEAETGKERHSWDAGISPYAGAMADPDGNVYCMRAVGKEGVQLVRMGADGKESVLHRQPEGQRSANRMLAAASPVFDAERQAIYFITHEDQGGWLHAWSVPEHKLRWNERFDHSICATPAVAPDGTIFLADLGGWVHALAPDGTRKHRYATGSEYLLAGGVCDQQGTVFIGDPLGVVHTILAHGAGKALWEAPGGIQGRLAFDAQGNLHVPATDRQVYVFANRTS